VTNSSAKRRKAGRPQIALIARVEELDTDPDRRFAELCVRLAYRVPEWRRRTGTRLTRNCSHHPSVAWRADLTDIAQLTVNKFAEEQSAKFPVAVRNPSSYDKIVDTMAFNLEPILVEGAAVL
jgi:hypothetical protein